MEKKRFLEGDNKRFCVVSRLLCFFCLFIGIYACQVDEDGVVNKGTLAFRMNVDTALVGVFMGVSAMYKDKVESKTNLSKAEQISKNFNHLVMQNYTTQRSVAWYAKKLGITPAHLSTIVKQTTDKTCVEIITSMVIMDAKAQLKSTDLSIHDIAYSLNFTNMSFFGKYFKRHVGMGPLEYRNS